MFLVIKAPHFTAGLELYKRAAPIIGYMINWDYAKILRYCKAKGWEVDEIPI